MSSIDQLVDKAMKTGMPAIALTDHGSMFGIKEFYNYVKKKNVPVYENISLLQKQLNKDELSDIQKDEIHKNIETEKRKLFKPIIGCETYVAHRSRFSKESQEDRSGYHLILLAKIKQVIEIYANSFRWLG